FMGFSGQVHASSSTIRLRLSALFLPSPPKRGEGSGVRGLRSAVCVCARNAIHFFLAPPTPPSPPAYRGRGETDKPDTSNWSVEQRGFTPPQPQIPRPPRSEDVTAASSPTLWRR